MRTAIEKNKRYTYADYATWDDDVRYELIDSLIKFNKYLRAGVKEYWIVDPDSKITSVYWLENARYIAEIYSDEDTIPVRTLDGCRINMKEVFENIWAE